MLTSAVKHCAWSYQNCLRPVKWLYLMCFSFYIHYTNTPACVVLRRWVSSKRLFVVLRPNCHAKWLYTFILDVLQKKINDCKSSIYLGNEHHKGNERKQGWGRHTKNIDRCGIGKIEFGMPEFFHFIS